MSNLRREREAGGGALTGATGDLVPPDPTEELVTGERREVESPAHRADVTAAMRGIARATHPDERDPTDRPVRGPTELANLTAGYGSGKGLSETDPAYQMEQHPSASEAAVEESGERATPTPEAETDQRGEEPERF